MCGCYARCVSLTGLYVSAYVYGDENGGLAIGYVGEDGAVRWLLS